MIEAADNMDHQELIGNAHKLIKSAICPGQSKELTLQILLEENWIPYLSIYSALSNRGTYTAICFAQKIPPIFPYSILYFY